MRSTASDIIVHRLKTELDRRYRQIPDHFPDSSLTKKDITYLLGSSKSLTLESLSAVCKILGLHPLTISSKNYFEIKTHFRTLSHNLSKYGEIQDVFYSISNFLNKYIDLDRDFYKNQSPRENENDKSILLSFAINRTNNVKNNIASTVPDILNYLNITTIPIFRSDLCFDGMLMGNNNVSVIFFNGTKPTNRIKFSLAHEISHFIFDRDKEIQVDEELNLYSDTFNSETKHEFLATKFAQYLLFPLDSAQSCASDIFKVKSNSDKVGQIIKDTSIDLKISPDVVLNGIKDIFELEYHVMFPYSDYKSVIDSIKDKSNYIDKEIQSYINKSKTVLREILRINNDKFSEERCNEILHQAGYA